MSKIAIAIVCKTPKAGSSKTRLSPPLTPDESASLSGCFIRDLSATISSVNTDGQSVGMALYTPKGSEALLMDYIPRSFGTILQTDGDFGERLSAGMNRIFEMGYSGAILVNSDSPTLPGQILRLAVDAIGLGDNVVLGPSADGGYTLIGLSRSHPRLFEDIPWSTSDVYMATIERAAEIGLPVVTVPTWYDVDDASSLGVLRNELEGSTGAHPLDPPGADAPATRDFLRGLTARRGTGLATL